MKSRKEDEPIRCEVNIAYFVLLVHCICFFKNVVDKTICQLICCLLCHKIYTPAWILDLLLVGDFHGETEKIVFITPNAIIIM